VHQLEAVHLRHLVVREDQRGQHAPGLVQRDAAILDRPDGEALPGQAVGHVVALGRRVVDDQDALARAGHGEERAHAGDQLLGRGRLDQVVVGAGVEAAGQIGGLAERGADQHRHVRRALLDRLAQHVAVHDRHLDVGDDQIGRALVEARQRLLAIGRAHHLVAGFLEDRGGVAVDERRVVDQQDAPLAATGRAQHREHVGVGERHQQEAVSACGRGRAAILLGRADDDDRQLAAQARAQERHGRAEPRLGSGRGRCAGRRCRARIRGQGAGGDATGQDHCVGPGCGQSLEIVRGHELVPQRPQGALQE
jgi:hypothetical protein